MTSKIFRATVLVAVIVLLCSLGVVMGVLYKHFTGVQVSQLKAELSLAATGTEQYGNAFLENIEVDRFRVTWIDTDGTVLFDTQVDQTAMQNHADREEIQEAFDSGFGSAVRNSTTLMEQTYYEARKLKDGTVLRVSANQQSAWALMVGLLWPVVLVALFAIALSLFLAQLLARKIVEPINELDLENPLKKESYKEITPLLHRIHRQNNLIKSQIEEMRRKSDEFAQISGNMQEGLVLLSSEGVFLSFNPAARQIFDIEDNSIGKNFLSIKHTSFMRDAFNDALDKGRGYARINQNGREYELNLSRIKSNDIVIGAVVLAFDITEILNAEQMRREFSANVSHELKTPIQGIVGSAELLESGMVKSEDVPRFVGLIRKESSRLVSLIEDIIRLSQLDEGVSMPTETVDMLSLAEDVEMLLEKSAAKKNVSISVKGSGFTIEGVARMLHEAIYNLCDNAIKYNILGGSVEIVVQERCLTVRDTGIGIPAEHKERIFERFYRVDKSHSKASGGTGLGLSIVKHVAMHHNAHIQLESKVGEGTAITIKF